MFRLCNSLRIAAALAVLLCASFSRVSAQGGYSDNGGASYQEFYDQLSPYGEWMNDPDYGYVWVPNAGSDFKPYYSNGYWANTEYGNTWVSSYDWGWAPFHYGRWTYNNYYGWVWIPGNTWGPAWVSWRSGGGAYGWAPLGPGISVSMGVGNYDVPDYWWTFTPQRYILEPNFHEHCYGPRYSSTYVHQTTIINNTYINNNNTYISGPRRSDMAQAIGRPVQPVPISAANRQGRGNLRNNSLSIYRPAISESAPRATERPQQVRQAEQPIGRPAAIASPSTIGRAPSAVPGRSQNEAVRPDNSRTPANNGRDFNQAAQTLPSQRAEQATPQRQNRVQTEVQQQQLQQQQFQQQRDQQNRAQMQQQQRDQQAQIGQQRQQMDQQQRAQQMQQQHLMDQQRAQQFQQQRSQQLQQQRAPQAQPQQMQRNEAPRQAPQREMSAPVTLPHQEPAPRTGRGGDKCLFYNNNSRHLTRLLLL